jgi:hypothetical protein
VEEKATHPLFANACKTKFVDVKKVRIPKGTSPKANSQRSKMIWVPKAIT